MPPKKTGTTKIKRVTGNAQPTLSFSQKKPGTSPAKSKSKSRKNVKAASPTPTPLSESEAEVELSPTVDAQSGRRSLNPKSKEWAGLYRDAKVAMGGMEPIHAGPDTHNQVHHILRVFDMTSKYGPSVGITRLQRWERAKKWGLNPPDEIHTILTTKEGQEDADYRENVLHTWI